MNWRNVVRRWELVEYEWDPETGVATLLYEGVREDTGETVTREVEKLQPAGPQHQGWYTTVR